MARARQIAGQRYNPRDRANMRTGGGIPSLHSWFADGGDGLLFDVTKLDRFFQENTGATLADDVGESIGLALDQHAWAGETLAAVVAAQSELSGGMVSNHASVIYAGGIATFTASTSGNGILTPLGRLTIGRTYKITVRVVSIASGSLRAYAGSGASGPLITSPGTYSFYLVASGTTQSSIIAFAAGTSAVVDSISIKEIPGNHGVQSSATLKPTRQTSGAKFDGSDDNLLTTYLSGSGANSIVALVTVPATIAATQIVAGAQDTSSTNRFWLGLRTTGVLGIGLGTTNTDAGSDIRGAEAVIALSCDGAAVKAFQNDAEVYSSAQSGVPTTTTPFRIGGLNSAGSASSFFGGSVKKLMTLRKALTLADYLKIRAAMLAD